MPIAHTLYNILRPVLPIRYRSPWGKRNTRASICVVSATRLNEHDFWTLSHLGRSVKLPLLPKDLIFNIAFENKLGLPEVYNKAIETSQADIIIFVHDDVWLDDIHFGEKLCAALKTYDVIGIAGNTRCKENQPSWFFISTDPKNGFVRDDMKYLSGFIHHGSPGASHISNFGPTPRKCKLIDGVFIAANRETLVKQKVKFDTSFKFDFYDLDFCKESTKRGLSIGTWPIQIIHKSAGNFGNPNWVSALDIYLKKWSKS